MSLPRGDPKKMPEVKLVIFKRGLGSVGCQSALFSLTWMFAVIVSIFRITPRVITHRRT